MASRKKPSPQTKTPPSAATPFATSQQTSYVARTARNSFCAFVLRRHRVLQEKKTFFPLRRPTITFYGGGAIMGVGGKDCIGGGGGGGCGGRSARPCLFSPPPFLPPPILGGGYGRRRKTAFRARFKFMATASSGEKKRGGDAGGHFDFIRSFFFFSPLCVGKRESSSAVSHFHPPFLFSLERAQRP